MVMLTHAKFSCVNFLAGGLGGCYKPPMDMFHYIKKNKKQAIPLNFNKLYKVDPLCINLNKNKELKKQQRWNTIKGTLIQI